MTMRNHKVKLTTAADGTVTGYTPKTSGKIHQIEYVKDGANGFADGVDFTITGEKTGISILAKNDVNASAVFAPRQPIHSQAGAALLYAAAGAPVNDRIGVALDRVKISVASGGNGKVGTFYVLIDDA